MATTSPLRQRMIEDMTIRKFAPKTQHDYVQRVKNFAAFLGLLYGTDKHVIAINMKEGECLSQGAGVAGTLKSN